MLLTIGDHIKTKRLEKKLLQKDLARIFCVDAITIHNWEKNKVENIPVGMMPKIIYFLGYCPVETFSTIGEKITLYRKYKGITQKAFAKMLGSDERYVSGWESGKRMIPENKQGRIKDILEMKF